MFEIKGKMNTAICYAKVVENEAIEQIRRMCDYGCTEGSKIRIMPDVHAGKGCTIGTTMTINRRAVPNVVGVDIGCGMYTVNLGKGDIDLEKFDEAAHYIPSGMNIWEEAQEDFDLDELRCREDLRHPVYLVRSLGTLGGGNHFIEIDRALDGTNYLVIHSGSRNLGKQVAELYQKLAINLHKGVGELKEEGQKIIQTLKEQGRQKEIQSALQELARKAREKYNDAEYSRHKHGWDRAEDIRFKESGRPVRKGPAGYFWVCNASGYLQVAARNGNAYFG